MKPRVTDERGQGERPRARDLGLVLGELEPGPHNAITDVEGVLVGHCTITEGEGALVPGEGPVRTGVTAIVPHGGNVFADKVPAAVHVINGFGKAVGFVQVEECGVLETPILLTNTLNVGRVADALVDYMLQDNRAIGITTGTVNPVVAECNDGYLNDIRGRHVGHEHVFAALSDADVGPVAEGAVGAGTGMTAFGWKGGIGTSSRIVPVSDHSGVGRDEYVLGALVLSNFGAARELIVGGWPVGRLLPDPEVLTAQLHGADALSAESPGPNPLSADPSDTDRPGAVESRIPSDAAGSSPRSSATSAATDEGDGSVVIVIATDAPLDARQLRRVAARAAVGIIRCGSRLSHGSGDYVIAFSTAHRVPHTLATESVVPGGGTGKDLAGTSVSRGGSPGSLARPTMTHVWPDDSPVMAGLLRGVGEATEEAVLNSMFQARTTLGRDGHVRHALPVELVRQLIRRFQSDTAD